MKKTDVIFIEDDPTVHEVLFDAAIQKGIFIHHFTNGEEGFNKLKSTHKIKGLILDGECYINKQSKTPEPKFLSEALRQLREIESQSDRLIPTVVFTGSPDQFRRFFGEENITIFSKGDGPNDMLTHLKKLINKSPDEIIRKKHPDVFAIFEKEYLSEKDEIKLLSIVKELNSNDKAQILNNIANVRPFLESIQTAMNKVDSNISPNNYSFNKFKKHLAGNLKYTPNERPQPTTEVYVGDYLSKLIDMTYSVSSIEGSHHSESLITKYTYNSLVNALLEILLWFGAWMDERSDA